LLEGARGSLKYIAPEVFNGEYSQIADMWSLGILTYILITGNFPFDGETQEEMYKKIFENRIKFTLEVKERTSPTLRRFIRRLVRRDVTYRLSAKSA
jgi:serine/threonine protein kinase